MRRRQQNSGADLLEENSPLDFEEQIQVIQELKKSQIRQELMLRLAFIAFGMAPVSIMYFYFAIQQLQAPWEQKHHARFTGAASATTLALLEGMSALPSCLVAVVLSLPMPALHATWCQLQDSQAVQCVVRQHPSLLSKSLLVSALLGAGILTWPWTLLLRQVGLEEGQGLGLAWDYAWLPGLPLLSAMSGLYAEHTLSSLAQEVEGLQHLTYNFKRV
eukprot:jgi/Botrbrau1/17991/Bobra.0460s0007.1